MDEFTPSAKMREEKWRDACRLIGMLAEIAKLLRNNGVEANNALWAMAEGKPLSDDPKLINKYFQEIRKKCDRLLASAETFRQAQGLDIVVLPELDWPSEHYATKAKQNKEYLE